MSTQVESSSDVLKIKEFIKKALRIKYFYMICTIVCLGLAYTVNKYSTEVYEVYTIVGPIEDERSGLLGSNEMFSGLEALSQSRNLQDDINSIKSFSLVTETIQKLSLEVGYFIDRKNILTQEKQLYVSKPYIVSIDRSNIQPVNVRFYITILDYESYKLTAFAEEALLFNYIDNKVVGTVRNLKIDTICKFNETISNLNYKFSVSENPDFHGYAAFDDVHFFKFYQLDNLTKQYMGRITVSPINLKSSLINARFSSDNPNMAVDFLNNYLQTFLDENLSKKNQRAINTIKFIDSQISKISDSLLISESTLRDYRSINQVTDLTYQGQQALELLTQIEQEISTLQVQERYYNYILDYFKQNEDIAGLAPPSSANVVDPIMNALILRLLELNSERATILSNNAGKNLFLGQIENKIGLQKQSILDNVRNNLNTLEITKNELNYRLNKVSREISKIPKTELNMVSMQRKFDLTDAIYTYLLQKRSEAAITMASNSPDFEILEPARKINIGIISPRKRINLIFALFFSFFIPTFYLILKILLNDKFTSELEVEQYTNQKVLNAIYKNSYKSEAVVSESPTSLISESFRNLRSTLFMKYRLDPLKVILVTSCQPKDGKSFVSFNLAASIAMVGHKTIILDGDMRRPTLHQKFKMDNTNGLSNYMSDKTPKESIIRKTNIDNLSFIPAGPSLYNTSELIEAGALDDIIDWLKDQFEYIIIDTTPAGIVSDSALMIKYASIVLLVARIENTRKEDMNDVIKLFQTNKIENYEIVINDLNIKESRYGKYNNYYTRPPKK